VIEMFCLSHKPLEASVYAEEFVGNTKHKTSAYLVVCKDLNTELIYKLPAEIAFCNWSNEKVT
jgi:RPE1 domain-containing protein